MRFTGECYRAHDPQWAWKALSGEGAAIHGGRFNPKGVPALYLALSLDGAVTEAAHGFAHRLEPLTICLYRVDCDDVIDLRTNGARRSAKVRLAEIDCAWALDVANGREPDSWKLTRRFMSDDAAGILVPSFARGAKSDAANLVLWKWGPSRPHKVDVYDPSSRLPKNMMSWT